MSFASALTIAWFLLLGRATREDWISAAYSKVFDDVSAVEKLRKKDRAKSEKLEHCHGITAAGVRLLYGESAKKINKLEHSCQSIKKGELMGLSMFSMPGYVLLREFDAIGKGGIHKAIITKSNELYGKKHGAHKAKQLLARLISYPILGIALSLTLGALLMGAGNASAGAGVVIVGTVLILVLIYTMYDDLNDRVKKRRYAISKQFPHVVSKLALLVTSGMIMDRAWKETAYSQETELYLEMRKTAEELDNLVSPEAAYGGFINRCNTKETARLASAIMQNMSKGNAEIGILLKNMAREAWQDRRRSAKRDAEKANAKLMIPTMLLFIAILIMLMVPVAMNFSGI